MKLRNGIYPCNGYPRIVYNKLRAMGGAPVGRNIGDIIAFRVDGRVLTFATLPETYEGGFKDLPRINILFEIYYEAIK